MTERDVHALRAQALARLAEATRAANGAPTSRARSGTSRRRRGKSWGIRRHISVQAGSGLVSASSWSRASF